MNLCCTSQHRAYEYIGVFRELYEAFVLSSFVYYIIELLGGEDELVSKLRRKEAKYGKHRLPCLGDWTMGRPFMMNCKYGVVRDRILHHLGIIYCTLLVSNSYTPIIYHLPPSFNMS